MRKTSVYKELPNGRVRCLLCGHQCVLRQGASGVCGVHVNEGGVLYTQVFGQAVSRGVDPIEKKPLFHFYPGSKSYSIATIGCNFRCRWCQNWQIAQPSEELRRVPGADLSPMDVVVEARRTGCRSVAYTYTEPTVFFEYAYETARLAHHAGLANVFVTNGYMTAAALHHIRPLLDAANVDLKAFRDETYRHYVGARLQPVLDTLKLMKQLGIWVEVTLLVIPDINDDVAELQDMANFIVNELGPDTPWHISRFFPAYQMADTAPTPLSSLQTAAQLGREAGLRYVYVGNAAEEADSACPVCTQVLIRRRGWSIVENSVDADSRCPNCGTVIAGIGMGGTMSRTQVEKRKEQR
jgi:pyruvate formate lyase activating enzyme